MADFKSVLFEQMIKDFAENEVKPLAQEVDEQERFPAALQPRDHRSSRLGRR